MALGDITLKGSQVRVSSFDSSDAAHDNPLDGNELLANGGLASLQGVINVGNNGVHGKIWIGTNGGWMSGPRGFVGPLDWSGPGVFSAEWLPTELAADIKSVNSPPAGGLAPQGDGTNFWVLNSSSDYFVNGDVELNNKVIFVAGAGAKLFVTGNFRMFGSSEIKISPGATLRMYVGRPDGPDVGTVIDGVNSAGNSAAFQYYGLPTNKSITWTGRGSYRGTIYAPQATLTMNGGGAATSQFIGASVVGEAVFNGHLHIHLDEDLLKR
jgi:hypothetical protein